MITLTHYGIREWGGALIAAVILIALFCWLATTGLAPLWIALAVLTLAVWLGVAAFFRNPRRAVPEDETLILSPADGVVRDLGEVEMTQEPFPGTALRIGIFLSVFNVHLNRASADWQLKSKVYREGRYLDARNSACAKENEAMTLAGTATVCGKTFPMGIRQISGAIARRIVCPAQPGETYRKGQIYGMIKFGSRTELYLPAQDGTIEVLVKPGDKVVAGITPMARIKVKTA